MLRKSAAFVAALAGTLWTATAGIGAETPMQNCSGFPCVSVRIGQAAPLSLAIDTGNVHSLLDLGRAKALGLALKPAKDAQGNPIAGYFIAEAKDVHVGGETLDSVKFIVADLHSDVADGTFPHADGTLSYADLKQRVLTLDYRRRAVTLANAPSAAPCPANCGTISYPTFGHHGPPIVVTSGFRVNGKEVSVQVDTLYSGTMLIYPTSVGRLGLSAEAASKSVDKFPFTDGGVDMIRGKASDESFGTDRLVADAPLYFATPKVHTPDGMFDGTVGAGLFAGHVVTLDFGANRFRIE